MREVLRYVSGILVYLTKLLALMLMADMLLTAALQLIIPGASAGAVLLVSVLLMLLLVTGWYVPFIKKLYLRFDQFLERKGFWRWISRSLDDL